MPRSTSFRLFRRDRAEVGVGTLIVFIAMVLVAAVAAAVIISTSGSLQERAMSTGKDATSEVSSNVKVVGIWGERSSTSVGIEELHFFLELSAGAPDLPLEEMVVRYSDGTNVDIYSFADAPTFTLDWIRGEGTDNVIRSGDLVALTFTVAAGDIPERHEIELTFIPETGNPIYVNLEMPSTYGQSTTVQLR